MDYHDDQEKKRNKQHRMKHYYDRHARPLSALQQGDSVRIQPKPTHKEWHSGKVTEVDKSGSYVVQTQNGSIRKNPVYLRKTCLPEEREMTSTKVNQHVTGQPKSNSQEPAETPIFGQG